MSTSSNNNRRLAHQLDAEDQQQEQQQAKRQKVNAEQVTPVNNAIASPNNEPASEKDFFIICKQLERKPSKSSKPQAILRRCKWGYPQVTFIKQSPQRQRDALSAVTPQVTGTLLWLTCPRIYDLVGKLEHDINKFNSIRSVFGVEEEAAPVKQKKKKKQADAEEETPSAEEPVAASTPKVDEAKVAQLIESHKNFEKFLSTLLTPEEFEVWRTGNPNGTVNDETIRHGNGGSRNPLSMKCLHAHVTSFLAGSNDLVGSYVVKAEVSKIVEATEKRTIKDIEDISDYLDCPSSCVKCKSYDAQYEKQHSKEKK